MTPDYLALLDAQLAQGRPMLGAATLAGATAVARAAQCPSGAFRGRLGGGDLYYTDYGTRLLHLLDPDSAGLRAVAGWIASVGAAPNTVVDRFCLLNAARLAGAGLPFAAAIGEALRSEMLPCGAFTRPGASGVSAYATFLASLSLRMLGAPPLSPEALQAVRDLRRPSGGYAEMASQPDAQTNSTAAALGVLVPANAIDGDRAAEACRFLAAMQAPDGGLRAHATASSGDLLSTFTGLLTLLTAAPRPGVDLSAVARFVSRCATGGGFGAVPGDQVPDVEYTWYGVACLGLLHAHVAAAGSR